MPILWDGSAPAPSRKKNEKNDSRTYGNCVSRLQLQWDVEPSIPFAIICQVNFNLEDKRMLYWALVFLVVALVAGVLGFTGVAVAAAGIAKILFVIFLILFLVSIVAHLGRGRSVS